jgi:hypothetical protein
MKNAIVVLFVILGATAFAANDQEAIERWWAHVTYLADDKLQGRQTGSDGHKQAARYVVDHFKKAGLKPGGTDGYLQPVQLVSRKVVEPKCSLALVRDGVEEPIRLGEEAMLNMRVDHAPSFGAPMVFAGYGLVMPELKYDDLAGLDLRGKVAVVLIGQPPGLSGPLVSHYQRARSQSLRAAGAEGTISVQNPGNQEIPWARQMPMRFFPQMSLMDPALDEGTGQLFSAAFNPAYAEKLFAGSGHTFKEIVDLANANKPLPRFPLKGNIKSRVTMEKRELTSDNVVGILPGTDPTLMNEYVVLSAHLDHVGVASEPVNGDNVFNGAMDNASGIASLLEIARDAAKTGGLKRSIAFLAATGEEHGHLGSRYFVLKPPQAVSEVVTNLNVDMFLPLFPLRSLAVVGLEESDLGDDLRRVGAKANLPVLADPEPERNIFIRSDQYSFIRAGIPALSMRVGFSRDSAEHQLVKKWLTERYHGLSDEITQPLDKQAAVDFNRVYVDLLEAIANRPTRPAWNDTSFFKRFAQGN